MGRLIFTAGITFILVLLIFWAFPSEAAGEGAFFSSIQAPWFFVGVLAASLFFLLFQAALLAGLLTRPGQGRGELIWTLIPVVMVWALLSFGKDRFVKTWGGQGSKVAEISNDFHQGGNP